jgi:hypothetical protein
MKKGSVSSTDDNSDIGKRSRNSAEDIYEFFLEGHSHIEAPGYDCHYTFSHEYVYVDKLLGKFEKIVAITEDEYEEDRRAIWNSIRYSYSSIDDTVPFSGLFKQAKGDLKAMKRMEIAPKKHKMRLREKQVEYQ